MGGIRKHFAGKCDFDFLKIALHLKFVFLKIPNKNLQSDSHP